MVEYTLEYGEKEVVWIHRGCRTSNDRCMRWANNNSSPIVGALVRKEPIENGGRQKKKKSQSWNI